MFLQQLVDVHETRLSHVEIAEIQPDAFAVLIHDFILGDECLHKGLPVVFVVLDS